MAIVRVRPFGLVDREMTDIQSEMNRLFDSFFGRGGQPGGVERMWAPAVDMYATANELVVKAELPGVSDKDITLSITGDMVSLRGERRWESQEKEQPDFLRAERWYGKFERALPLPFPVQPDKVKAAFKDGVLTITLPKAEQIRSREIKIDTM
jgi:HSP20 family protein